MVTELQKSIAIAMLSGFVGGAFKSCLTDILYNGSIQQTISPKNPTLKYLLNGLENSIFLVLLVFMMFIFDAVTSFTKLNYLSLTFAIIIGVNSLLTKLSLSLWDRLKNNRSKI